MLLPTKRTSNPQRLPLKLVLHLSIRKGAEGRGREGGDVGEGGRGRGGNGGRELRMEETEQVWVLTRGKEEDW